jgi:hypothetical protein
VLVEQHVVGLEVARVDLVGFELAAGVDDGVEEVPDLSGGRATSFSVNLSWWRLRATISSLMLML